MSVTLELFNAINEGDVDAVRVLLKIATAEDVNCQDEVNFHHMQIGKFLAVWLAKAFFITHFYDRLETRF